MVEKKFAKICMLPGGDFDNPFEVLPVPDPELEIRGVGVGVGVGGLQKSGSRAPSLGPPLVISAKGIKLNHGSYP